MNKKISILVVVLVLAILAGGGFWFVKNKGEKKEDIAVNQENNQEKVVTQEDNQYKKESDIKEIDTSNWQTYKNEEYGFEVKYPKEWEKEEVSKKSNLGNEYYVAFMDQERKDSLMSPFYDEDIVIRYFSNIEVKKKNINDKIKNLDDYVNSDYFIADFGCLYKKEVVGSLGEVYVVELGGNYGHYALMLEAEGNIYEIIFGREKTFGENCKDKKFEILDFLSKKEFAIINSFKTIE